MIAVFSILSKDFYSFLNISTMLTNISFSGIVAGTLTMILITGGLDISIGGNIALTSCLAAYLFNLENPVPGWALIPIALALGAAIGAFNGVFITRLDLNPIITTLGTMAVTRGLGYVLTKSRSILIMEDVTGFIGRTVLPGIQIPVPLVLMVITYLVLFFLLGKSKFGRKVYCIGANQAAARVSGIRVNSVKFILYLISGITASVSGLILTGQTAVGMPQHANGVELDVITAVLLGGTALSGGKGDILGTLAGVLILGVLYNGFTMIGFRYVHIRVFQGILLILIVALYELRDKKKT
jgi:ribose transport system permease protein